MKRRISRKKRAAVFISAHPDSIRHAIAGIHNADALIRIGIESNIFLLDLDCKEQSSNNIDLLMGNLQNSNANVMTIHNRNQCFDIGLFFGWRAANYSAETNYPLKFNVFNDIEAWNYPMGDNYIAAENAMLADCPTIAIGKWVGHALRNKFCLKPIICDADKRRRDNNVSKSISKNNALCASWDSHNPNHCSHFIAEACGIFHHKYPQVEIIFISSQPMPNIWYSVTHVSSQLEIVRRKIYDNCFAGISLNTTAEHNISSEMLRSGLPVVDLYLENNLYDYSDDQVLLAHQAPESIFAALEILYRRGFTREPLNKYNHSNFYIENEVNSKPLTFEAIIKEIIEGRDHTYFYTLPIKKTYKQPAVTSPYFTNPAVIHRTEFIRNS